MVFIILIHEEKRWIRKVLVWKSFVLVHVHVLHILLCTSQNGNGGKSCTECTGQSEGSSPGTGGGVCTNTKIILGLWGCAWSPRQGQCQVSAENLLWLKSNWGLVMPWIWWVSDLGNRMKTGRRNAFQVVTRSSHLQAPALGLSPCRCKYTVGKFCVWHWQELETCCLIDQFSPHLVLAFQK